MKPVLVALLGLVNGHRSHCGDATVHVVGGHTSNHPHEYRLDHKQAQMVLAHHAQVSRFQKYTPGDHVDRTLDSLSRTLDTDTNKFPTIVVTSSLLAPQLVDSTPPVFTITRSPSAQFFEQLFGSFARGAAVLGLTTETRDGGHVISRTSGGQHRRGGLFVLRNTTAHNDILLELQRSGGLLIQLPADTCLYRHEPLSCDVVRRSGGRPGGQFGGHPGGKMSQVGYQSQDECNRATRQCSGHGECTGTESGAAQQVYTCRCQAQVDKRNKRTTYWTGGACEKQDVSVQTQMFVWTGVGFVGAVAGGVALLLRLGSSELPGILA